MKIHIVCSRLNVDRILPRLAKALAVGTGWGLSETPDPSATLNYFFPYLELQKREWTETPTAAWFTHRDDPNPSKASLWDEVAGRVDLRLTSTPLYLNRLKGYGPAHHVQMGLDRDFFDIGPYPTAGRVVGVSSWTYGDGRKGEDLIAKLVRSEVGQSCHWKASGRGWENLHCKTYAWNDMAKFYQSLDLLVCASRIEGPGFAPVEALACGVPVVVPRGVGIYDELPDIHGIWRFEAGDYESLLAAFTAAMSDGAGTDRRKLRAVTEPYSLTNWCADHETVFEEFLYGDVPAELPGWQGRTGMYVVAFGQPSRRCAVRCIQSFKQFNPGVPVALVAETPLGAGEDLFIRRADLDVGGRQAKLAVDQLAPREWQYVLYLDADQEVKEPLDFLFDLAASGWEFAICRDMAERFWLRTMRRGDNEAEYEVTVREVGTDRVHQYNGGMFVFRRCDRTRRFFEIWNQEYQKWLGRDQGALIRALYRQPLRMVVLNNQWNASARYERPAGPIAVLHHNMEARRWGRSIRGRIDGDDAWKAVREWERAQV